MKLETSRTRRFQLLVLLSLIAFVLIACGGKKDDPQPTDTPEVAAAVQEEPTATDAPKPTNTPEPTEAPEKDQPASPLNQPDSPLAQPDSPLAQPKSPLDAPGG